MLSLELVRSIHADRLREVERAIRDRRLLQASETDPVVRCEPRASATRDDRQTAGRSAATAAGPTT